MARAAARTHAADWTGTAAKWCAVGVLGALCAAGVWLSVDRVPRESAAAPGAGGEGRADARPDAVADGGDRAGRAAPGPSVPASVAALIDVNAATREELESLPGIGPALAGRIIESRDRFGRFAGVESLTRVKGIGPKTVERLRPLVKAGP